MYKQREKNQVSNKQFKPFEISDFQKKVDLCYYLETKNKVSNELKKNLNKTS